MKDEEVSSDQIVITGKEDSCDVMSHEIHMRRYHACTAFQLVQI